MTQHSDKARARRYARLALENIEALDLTASPETFALFYAYASGTPQSLARELGQLLGDPEQVTDEVSRDLYRAHLTVGSEGGQATDLVNATATLVETLKQTVDRQDAQASHRLGALKRIESILGRDPKPERIGRALLELNEHLGRMIEENQSLRGELNTANARIKDLTARVEAVTRSSLTDPLTGLGNRAAFDRRLREAHQLKARTGFPSTLILLDIDHFKAVNDQHGHAVGDEVLKLIARNLETFIRGSDVPVRQGGEEFAAILPGTTLVEGRRMAERVREAIATLDIGKEIRSDGLERVTASFGVAELEADMAIEAWVELADKALYRAKANGRNRVVTASELTETKALSEISVLIVEDDPTSATLLKHMLGKLGVKAVQQAGDGAAALAVLERDQVDCVICDGVMPEMDGLEFTIRVRTGATHSAANLPIMLLTARQEEAWATAARDAGANEFLTKPVSLERLEGAVRALLFEPRKFIKSRGYVGPDRRTFQDPAYSGPERRAP